MHSFSQRFCQASVYNQRLLFCWFNHLPANRVLFLQKPVLSLRIQIVCGVVGGNSSNNLDSGRAKPRRGVEESVPGVCQPQPVFRHVFRRLPSHDQLLSSAAGAPLLQLSVHHFSFVMF